MAIYLVQHGKSRPKTEDPHQGLSDEGVAETRRIAQVAAGYGVAVAAIVHSGKPRALQTAEIMAEALQPAGGVGSRGGLKPLDDVTALAQELDSDSNLMFVGHLPFMQRLTGHLTAGQANRPVFRFQNGGIVCLDREAGNGPWQILWALMPHVGTL